MSVDVKEIVHGRYDHKWTNRQPCVCGDPGPQDVFAFLDSPTGREWLATERPIDPPDEDAPDLSELPADVPDERVPEDDAQVAHEAPTEEN